MPASFELAVLTVLKHEAGYVWDPRDPGGETKYGISKRSYPNEDIKNLTEDRAKDLYFADYWLPYHYDQILDQEIATKIFDICVTMNQKTCHRAVQRALRAVCNPVVEDGILGPKTLQAINLSPPDLLLAALRSEFACTYREIGNPTFLRGWLNRAYS